MWCIRGELYGMNRRVPKKLWSHKWLPLIPPFTSTLPKSFISWMCLRYLAFQFVSQKTLKEIVTIQVVFITIYKEGRCKHQGAVWSSSFWSCQLLTYSSSIDFRFHPCPFFFPLLPSTISLLSTSLLISHSFSLSDWAQKRTENMPKCMKYSTDTLGNLFLFLGIQNQQLLLSDWSWLYFILNKHNCK